MSRSVVGVAAVGALLFVLQHVLLNTFTIFGIHPELMLLFAVCCGLAGGPNQGVVAGFAAGLAGDAFLTSPMGLSAFAFGVAGYLAGVASDDTTSTPTMTALAAAGCTALGLFLVLFFGNWLGHLNVSFSHSFAVMFWASLFNAVLAIPVRRALSAIRTSATELAW